MEVIVIKNYTDSLYNISTTIERDINKIISRYFKTINNNISNELLIDDYYLGAILYLIYENFDYFQNKDHWMNNLSIIMLRIKELIENGYFNTKIGFYNGLAEIDMAVHYINKKTGAYSNFSKILHNKFINNAYNYLNFCMSNFENLQVTHYDLVYGLSGIGESVLCRDELTDQDYNLLKDISMYLVILSSEKIIYEKVNIPRFHIKSKNQIRDDEKEDFPQGNLNFGLAHGMLAPMIFMAKSKERGITIHKQTESIYRLYEQYEFFKSSIDGISHWPTQLSTEDYDVGKIGSDYRLRRASWCYGTAGISRGLHLVGKSVNDIDIESSALENLKSLAKLNVKEYLLNSPTFCHGLAGLLAIFNIMYYETKDTIFKEGVEKVLTELIKMYDKESKYGFIAFDEAIINDKVEIVTSESLDALEGTSGVISTLISLYNGQSILQKKFFIV